MGERGLRGGGGLRGCFPPLSFKPHSKPLPHLGVTAEGEGWSLGGLWGGGGRRGEKRPTLANPVSAILIQPIVAKTSFVQSNFGNPCLSDSDDTVTVGRGSEQDIGSVAGSPVEAVVDADPFEVNDGFADAASAERGR